MDAVLTSAQLAGRVVAPVGAALKRLPPALPYALVDGAGLLAWALDARRRRATALNVGRLLDLPAGSPRVQRLARQAFKNYGRMSLDFFTMSATTDAEFLARAEISGKQYLDDALAHGRGVIFALPHLGSWDLAARFGLALDVPLTGVVENDWSAEFATQARTAMGVTVVPRDRSLRPLLRALSRNQAVALICDIVPPGAPAVAVCFAGQRAVLPAGPARLSLRSGAPILPCAVVALPDGRIEAGCAGAIYPPRATGEQDATQAMTQELACLFEQLIRRHPEQWYAFRPLEAPVHAA